MHASHRGTRGCLPPTGRPHFFDGYRYLIVAKCIKNGVCVAWGLDPSPTRYIFSTNMQCQSQLPSSSPIVIQLFAHVLDQTFQALVLFTVPLCILALHTHIHLQIQVQMQRPPPFVRRRSAGALCSTPSSSSTSSSIAFTRASTSTSTRVSQPAQPLHSVGSDTRFGPRSPILHDGDKRHYRVEGLIDAGGCARVALATAVGTPSPRLFAIKVYSRTRAGASMMMMMHENERRILQENTRRKSRWLVGSRAAFGDSWNRYLVMVRRSGVQWSAVECSGTDV